MNRYLATLLLLIVTGQLFAAQQVITPNAGITLPAGRDMINANFTELYARQIAISSNATWLTVGGSPTSSGTITINLASGQTANRFLATPNGSTGTVTLRAIAATDLPDLSGTYQPLHASLTAIAANSGTVNLSGLTLTLPSAFVTLSDTQTLTNKTISETQIQDVVAALTAGSTVATNAVVAGLFTLTATSDFTLSNPSNPADGMKRTWRIKLAGHTATLGSAFRLPTGVTMSWDASKWNYLGARYNVVDSKWDILSFAPGY